MAQVLTFPQLGSTITLQGQPVTVQPPCTDAANGRWYCVTHHEAFMNQFEKDAHIHRGRHEMVWICFRHGPETDPKWSTE